MVYTYPSMMSRASITVLTIVLLFFDCASGDCVENPGYWSCRTVQPNECLASIAATISMDFRILCQFNLQPGDPNCTALVVGSSIRIPDGELLPYRCNPTPYYLCYTLDYNENLATVRYKFNIPLESIMQINPLISSLSLLMPGTQVRVPIFDCRPDASSACYTTPTDTTLPVIADNLGFYYDTLVTLNQDRIWCSGGAVVPAGRPVYIPTCLPTYPSGPGSAPIVSPVICYKVDHTVHISIKLFHIVIIFYIFRLSFVFM